MMSIANVSLAPPITNYDYRTFTTDKAVNQLNSYHAFVTLPGNIDPLDQASMLDQNNHAFVEAYLFDSAARRQIVDGIIARLKATKAPSQCNAPFAIVDMMTPSRDSPQPSGQSPAHASTARN